MLANKKSLEPVPNIVINAYNSHPYKKISATEVLNANSIALIIHIIKGPYLLLIAHERIPYLLRITFLVF